MPQTQNGIGNWFIVKTHLLMSMSSQMLLHLTEKRDCLQTLSP